MICLCVLSVVQFSFGQLSFSHSLGGAYYATSITGAPGIMYSPRLNFMELSDETTVSIGTHLGLGVVFNSRDGGSNSYVLDLPIVAEINFGLAANQDTRSSFGGFVGLGYGFNRIGADSTFGSDFNEGSGVLFNGGLRAIIKERPLGLRVSYMLNSDEEFEDVISVGLFYIFGGF
ncbi:MAG: hypothetical protein MRY83_19965 [Flavobacteriales bacterium]|nr:hypothetical protein [Flavobacteriales bacterium]